MRKLFRLSLILAILLTTLFYFAIRFRPARAETCEGAPDVTTPDGEWSTGSGMEVYRSEHAAAVLDGKIYIVGGLSGSSKNFLRISSAMEVYDPAKDEWTRSEDIPMPLHHTSLTADDQRLYLTGGADQFNNFQDKAWSFDPTEGEWKELPTMPAERYAHASAVIDGKLYVVGGVGQGSDRLFVYDPATQTWDDSRARLPTIREHLAAAVIDGKLYVIGGRWNNGNSAVLEVYDPVADTWERLASMPTPRGGLTAAAVNGKLHVGGGELYTSNQLCTYAQHEVFDPTTGEWTNDANLPTSRHGFASAGIDGKWYVIGGGAGAASETTSTLTNIVEIFTPDA